MKPNPPPVPTRPPGEGKCSAGVTEVISPLFPAHPPTGGGSSLAAAPDRAQVANEVLRLVWPMQVTDAMGTGICGLVGAVWVTIAGLLVLTDTPWGSALRVGFFAGFLLPTGFLIVLACVDDVLRGRVVVRFDVAFANNTPRRTMAVSVLRGLGDRKENIRKLLLVLGELVQELPPEVEAGDRVGQELDRLRAGQESGTVGHIVGSTAAPPPPSTSGPAPLLHPTAPPRPRPGLGGGVIPLDPFDSGKKPTSPSSAPADTSLKKGVPPK